MVDKYASSNKGLKWSFTLRDGLKFHDGAAVTAEDAVESLKRWSKKDPLGRLLAAHMAKIAPSDRKTFTLELSQPFGLVLDALGKPSSNVPFIMPPRAAAASADEPIKETIGSGPFKFVRDEWQPGNQVVYVKNPDYVPRQEKPSGSTGGKVVNVDRVVWRYIPDHATANAALDAGEVDWWENPPLDFVPKIEANAALRTFVTDPRGTQGWIRPNHKHPPFNNKKARQALLYIVDQPKYLKAAIGVEKYYKPCPALFTCGGPFESAAGAPGKPDLDRARQLVKESGYDGRPVVVLDPSDIALTRPREAEAARRGDPEGRLRRGDVRAVRPVGAAHRPPQGDERGAPVPGTAVLERVDRLIVFPEILRRLVATIPVMGVVAIAVFALLHVTPGDPAVIIAGDYATSEDIAKIRAKLGLDPPFLTQVGIWLSRIVRGDLGTSICSGLPVATLIGQRAEATIALTLFAMVISVSLAVPLGVLAAWKKGSLVDRAVMVFAVSGFSMPTFWLGFVLVYVFAVSFHWLPVQGFQSLERGAWPFLRHLILPAVTLSLVYMALIARMTRASMLGVLNEDYIRTAFAKGLAPRWVLVRHALKNASLPIVTIIGIGFALLIGGAVVTESVFALPGLGRLTVDAIIRRDYPVIQGVILVVSG